MIFNLIAVVVLGVAAAASIMMVFKMMGRPPPKWLLPIGAGVAMFGFVLYNDYTWYPRTAGALPDHVAVAGTYTQTHPLQPWTYLVAPVNRFAVVDRQRVVPSPQHEDLVLAEVSMVSRFMPTGSATFLIDCDEPRRADATQVTGFDDNGQPVGARWIPVAADDPVRRIACAVPRPATS